VGRVEAYIITALHYIAQKNAADAFITHGYIAFAPRLSTSDFYITIATDIAVSGCCYYECSHRWISTAAASSPSLPSYARCHLDASIVDADVRRYLLHEVCMYVVFCHDGDIMGDSP
jgi:hypothetical protein